MYGFKNLKDILDVLIIPIVIFGLGALLPRWLERRKRKSFISLIKRELKEMEPRPAAKEDGSKWYLHLKKRFIHEAIFQNPSDNRDFILSLQPDLAYNEAQLWIHYKKAKKSENHEDLAEHGASWCDYLRGICTLLDKKKGNLYYNSIYKPWEKLVLSYHPNLEKTGRLISYAVDGDRCRSSSKMRQRSL